MSVTAAPGVPFKFLNPYGPGDVRFFFGRDRETRTLLADVLVSRLVVLFARTGTGKTSLINAGVRPRLDDLGFRTVYVRVSKDPTSSAREALAEIEWVGQLPRRRLSEQLVSVARRAGAPLVLFFDQFEEFFIYLMSEAPDAARTFIAEVARLRESGDVHVVLSLREEFFVDLDAFRDEIPTIFYNDSNLRLRWFEPGQAREAILGPAHVAGVEVDEHLETLADRIVADLSEAGRIEPARLQIVCSTLWRDGGERLRADDYDRLGGAAQIVARRLEEDVRDLEVDQLRLFERLLPELRTAYGTKYLRGVEELSERLDTDRSVLDELVERLKDAHLLGESSIHGARYIEWATDYLAERTEYLRTRARALLHRKLLDGALAAALEAGDESDPALAAWAWGEAEPTAEEVIARDDFENLSREAAELGELTRQEAAIAFGAALAHGLYARQWFDEGGRRGVDVWSVLRHAIRRDQGLRQPAESTLQLLGEVGDREATSLLEATLDDPELAPNAFAVLTRMTSDIAVEALERATTEDDAKAGPAIDALRRARTPAGIDALTRVVRRGGVTGLRAGLALETLATEVERRKRAGRVPASVRRLARAAEAALDDVVREQGAELLRAALELGLQARFWFDRARRQGIDVWEILRAAIVEPTTQAQAEGALQLLGELPDARARELLDLANRQQRVGPPTTGTGPREARIERRARPPQPLRADGGLRPADWDTLVRRIADGRCLPILGPGTSLSRVPMRSELAERWASRYGYPLGDRPDLARVAQFMAVVRDPVFPKEAFVQELLSWDAREPGDAYRVLAGLPLPLYVTTDVDDLMVRALQELKKSPKAEICPWTGRLRLDPDVGGVSRDPSFDPTPGEPLVYYLHGHIRVPESIVLTDDDYFDFLVAVTRDERLLPPQIRAAVATTSLLFVGFNLTDLAYRVVNRGLVMTGEPALRRVSLIVQSVADAPASSYLEAYFGRIGMRVYWGSPDEFADELARRWEAYASHDA